MTRQATISDVAKLTRPGLAATMRPAFDRGGAGGLYCGVCLADSRFWAKNNLKVVSG